MGAPAGFVSALQSADENLGYTRFDVYPYTKGWYAKSSSAKFDFHTDPYTARGLAQAMKDPFEALSTVSYDQYSLMPVESTVVISLGNELTTSAEYDYRVLQASLITDPNGNRAAFAFTPLGLLHKSAAMGKASETKGDTLAHPSVWMEYDFFAWKNHRQPVWVHTYQRVNHWHDNINNEVIEAVEYSDGFGRLLQTRSLAEDVIFGDPTFGSSGLPADPGTANAPAVGIERGANSPVNVRVSGWTVYDNKGRPIEQYEPFFSTGFSYIAPYQGAPGGVSQFGQKVRMYYDPRGQVVRTVNPDGSEQRVIFGVPRQLENLSSIQPTPWEKFEYDGNDLANLTHGIQSQTSIEHFWTPKSCVFDALKRVVKTVDYLSNTDSIAVSYRFDIKGKIISVQDALGRQSFRNYYDLRSNILKTDHIDLGIKTFVIDVESKKVMTKDSRDAIGLYSYDTIGRPTKVWARDNTTETISLREQFVYGDGTDGPTTPKDTNHLGKLYMQYDQAGMTTYHEYDFKGNILFKTQSCISDEQIADVFDSPPIDWQVSPFVTNWETNPMIEGNFETHLKYNALDQIIQAIYPTDVSAKNKVQTFNYNRAGLLRNTTLQDDIGGTEKLSVAHISYDAQGKKSLVVLGNGFMTRFTYDYHTFRLKRTRTEKYLQTSPFTFEPNGSTQYDITYTHDLAGNIIQIFHNETGCGVGGTNSLIRNFKHDASYRLIEATGRENSPTSWFPGWEDAYRSTDYSITTGYRQKYTYDEMGNMLSLQHIGNNNFTRHFSYGYNNQLTSIAIGGDTYSFHYDAVGNLIGENSNRRFDIDYCNKPRAFIDQAGTSEPTKYTHYLYNSAGERVKKITRKSSSLYEVTIYLGGTFEYVYKYDGASKYEEYNEVHLLDDKGAIARLRVGFDDGTPEVKYIIDDHLGSSAVILDGDGIFFSREEYYPFGESSFGSFAKNRYRYVGKERDDETGLYYYGDRYYAAWCCRFISADSLFMEYPYYSPYQYAGNKPIRYVDLDGKEEAQCDKYPGSPVNPGTSDGQRVILGNKAWRWFPTPDKRRQDKSMWVPELSDSTLLNDRKNIIRGIDEAKKNGHTVAAENLERWLNGIGGNKTESLDWLRKSKGFNTTVDKHKSNYYNVANSQGLSILHIAKNVGDGQVIRFNDWQSSPVLPLGGENKAQQALNYVKLLFTEPTDQELFYAWGTSNLSSSIDVTISRDGDLVNIKGNVTFIWNDTYNWEPCHKVDLKYTDENGELQTREVKDEQMKQHEWIQVDNNVLAQPFEGSAAWTEEVNITVDIKNLKVLNNSFNNK